MKSSSKKKSYHQDLCITNTNSEYYDSEQTDNDNCGCSIVCSKSLAIIFNFLLILSAFLLVSSSIFTMYYKQDYMSLFPAKFYLASTYLTIVSGVLALIAGFIGIYTVWNEMKNVLIFYLIFLIIIIVVELIAGTLVLSHRATLNSDLKNQMNRIIKDEYGNSGFESQTQLFDEFQQKFKCCGASDFTDWKTSSYVMAQKDLTNDYNYNKVSESCCKTPSKLCAIRDHPSNINSNGCADAYEKSKLDHLLLYGLLIFAICFFQLSGLCIVGVLVRNIGERKKYEFISNNTSEITN